MNNRYYAGIGSRQTPTPVLHQMHRLAEVLEEVGYTLRSGHAHGADQAFATAVTRKQIMLPWEGYNGARSDQKIWFVGANPYTERVAAAFHPAWHNCTPGARKLHARNTAILAGLQPGDATVEFIICWTKDGKDSGGTGQAIRIAEAHHIPVFNLFDLQAENQISDHLRSQGL